MSIWQILLIDLGRIGMGLAFVISVLVDLRARRQLFQLMRTKKVPLPWVFYGGAVIWKTVTGLLLIVNIFTAAAALLLSLYIFIANLIFNSFWKADKDHRDFSLYLFLVYLASCFGLLVIAGFSL